MACPVARSSERLVHAGEERYQRWWHGFGAAIKRGLAEDADNQERLAALLRLHSTHSSGQLTSLAGYLRRMRLGQDCIRYLSGPPLCSHPQRACG